MYNLPCSEGEKCCCLCRCCLASAEASLSQTHQTWFSTTIYALWIEKILIIDFEWQTQFKEITIKFYVTMWQFSSVKFTGVFSQRPCKATRIISTKIRKHWANSVRFFLLVYFTFLHILLVTWQHVLRISNTICN